MLAPRRDVVNIVRNHTLEAESYLKNPALHKVTVCDSSAS